MEKGTQNTTYSHLLGVVSQLKEFPTIPSQTLHHIQFREYIVRNPSHFLQKESVTTQYSSSKSVTHLTGPQNDTIPTRNG